MAPAPEPATIPTTVHLAHFTVTTADGTTRVWDGPSTKLNQISSLPAGKRVACDAWMRGESRLDKSTGRYDPLWFHLAPESGGTGWVPSAHTIGYPPGT